MTARWIVAVLYDGRMKNSDPLNDKYMPDEALEDYLRLCQEIFLKMQKAGTWPWPDSHNSEDLLESTDT